VRKITHLHLVSRLRMSGTLISLHYIRIDVCTDNLTFGIGTVCGNRTWKTVTCLLIQYFCRMKVRRWRPSEQFIWLSVL